MISWHRFAGYTSVGRQFGPSSIIWTCRCSTKETGKEITPVQTKSNLESVKRKSDLKVAESDDNVPMEPDRDNRIMVKRPFFHIDNFLPTNWVNKAITLKNNYFYPPASVVFKKDGVSRARYTICYRAEWSRLYIGWSAALTPVIAVLMAYLAYHSFTYDPTGHPDYDPYEFDTSTTAKIIFVLGSLYYVIGFNYITRMKVIRMYYSKEKQNFIIVWFNPWCPLFVRKMECKPGAAKIEKGLVKNTNINGKRFLIGPDNFSFSTYFNVLYGYQNPKDIEKILDGNESADQFFRSKKKSERSNIYHINK